MQNPVVTITMDDDSQIMIELYPEIAPESVKNFVSLVSKGFYNGLTFHRIIPGFMIQGGDPEGTGRGGSDENIFGEFKSNGINNELEHTRGVISMARAMNPNSASSQFFIMHKDAPHLDGGYAAFGAVVSGIEVVDNIASTRTNHFDNPYDPVVIDYVKVL